MCYLYNIIIRKNYKINYKIYLSLSIRIIVNALYLYLIDILFHVEVYNYNTI